MKRLVDKNKVFWVVLRRAGDEFSFKSVVLVGVVLETHFLILLYKVILCVVAQQGL